jgi:uncharacterized membrane protein YeaQ/YmgE (transglycosylase-associated protein family)
MLWLLMWTIYGLVVGLLAKVLARQLKVANEDLMGFLPTIGVGVAGSYIGGFINFILGRGNPFATSGIIMGIIGGVVFCYIYHKIKEKHFLEMQKLNLEMHQLKMQKSDD